MSSGVALQVELIALTFILAFGGIYGLGSVFLESNLNEYGHPVTRRASSLLHPRKASQVNPRRF